MYRLQIAELNISEIIERHSVKYRASKRNLWEDWQKQTQWVYDVFDLELAQAPRSTYATAKMGTNRVGNQFHTHKR